MAGSCALLLRENNTRTWISDPSMANELRFTQKRKRHSGLDTGSLDG